MSNEIKHCNGCERQCEYDYFTRTRDGSTYPVIGKKIIQNYCTTDGTHIFISSAEIRSAEAAIKLAQKISLMCKNHFNNQPKTK